MGDFDVVGDYRKVLTSVRIVPVILGICLLGSVFLPWVSFSLLDVSVSGADLDTELIWYGIVGGGAVVAGSFFEKIKTMAIIYFTTGFMSFVVIFFPVASDSGRRFGPELGVWEAIRNIIDMANFGFYLHFICVFAFLFLGLTLFFTPEPENNSKPQ
ncbi:MAG: hypothetical protein K9J85_01980 [Desulfobacteraceae bacterium]|nr:hypothetical protein [Desulfobacteraceae bacterium]